jgi:hypothetical protein
MPYDTGTAQLINQLTNPPSPFEQYGKTLQFADQYKQFQANKAISDIYGQSIDPQTGQVDLGKFNALAQQNPAALWKFGAQMQQAGVGVQAQGAGTSAQLQAAQDQLGAQAAYLQPLLDKVVNQQKPVTGAELSAALANMPPGLVPPSSVANIQRQIAQIGPNGDASGIVRGAAFANDHGQAVLKSVLPNFGAWNAGGVTYPTQTNPMASGGVQYPRQGVPSTPSADTMSDIVTVTLSDNTTQQMSRADALNAIGSAVPGKEGVTVLGPPPGGYPVVTRAQPAAPSGQGASGTTPAVAPPTPSGRINPPQQPAAGSAQPPPQGQPAPGGATYGRSGQPGQLATTEDSAAQFRADRADQSASVNRVATIENAQKALEGATTGPGTQVAQAVQGVLGTWTPDVIKKAVPGADFQQRAADYDEANKYLTQIANANGSAIGGQVTNDKLAAATVATPNVHIQKLATDQLLQVLKAQENMKQTMFAQSQADGVTPQQYADWKANWAKTHDPRAFLPMTPSRVEYLKKTIKPGTPEEQNFMSTLNQVRGSQGPSTATGQE